MSEAIVRMTSRAAAWIGVALVSSALFMGGPAAAQGVPSTCIAMAQTMPERFDVTMVALDRSPGRQTPAPDGSLRERSGAGWPSSDAASPLHLAEVQDATPLARGEVRITYVRHATFLIESPQGVTAATDYAGDAGGIVPDIVTMNNAHSSHWTPYPDPAIKEVLRGWNPDGPGPARHAVTVGDMYVRNVPTDVRSFGGAMRHDGNSIFIFEVAGLCIGHLGHLHQDLTDEDYAKIGRLDVVMVPVDGGYTMSQTGIGDIVQRLHSSIVLPMHRFAGPIERFLSRLPDFAVERSDSPSLTVSMRSLPKSPTVIVLAGV